MRRATGEERRMIRTNVPLVPSSAIQLVADLVDFEPICGRVVEFVRQTLSQVSLTPIQAISGPVFAAATEREKKSARQKE